MILEFLSCEEVERLNGKIPSELDVSRFETTSTTTVEMGIDRGVKQNMTITKRGGILYRAK